MTPAFRIPHRIVGQPYVASWFIDRRLGADADLDEEAIKLAIADLCERNFTQLNETRQLIATAAGTELWKKFRNY